MMNATSLSEHSCPENKFTVISTNGSELCIPCKLICGDKNQDSKVCLEVCPEFYSTGNKTDVDLLTYLLLATVIVVITLVLLLVQTFIIRRLRVEMRFDKHCRETKNPELYRKGHYPRTHSYDFGTGHISDCSDLYIPRKGIVTSVSQQSIITLERLLGFRNCNPQEHETSKKTGLNTKEDISVLSRVPSAYMPCMPCGLTVSKKPEEKECNRLSKSKSYSAFSSLDSKDDVLEQIRQNTAGHVPEYVFAVQLCKSNNSVFVYIDQDRETEGREFVDKYFSQYQDKVNVRIIPSEPPEDLQCEMCNEATCPSITGHAYDVNDLEYIGPGSRIFAVESSLWEDISDKVNVTICTFKDVEDTVDKLVENNPGKYEIPSRPKSKQTSLANRMVHIPSWSLGFRHEIDVKGKKKDVFVSTAHSLSTDGIGYNSRDESSPGSRNENLVFVTELKRNGHPTLEVISTEHWGIYRKKDDFNRACTDILIMFPKEGALDLYRQRMVNCCSTGMLDCNIEMFNGYSKELIGVQVSKQGYFSGATYGEVIEMNLLTNEDGDFVRQNVFGVISTMPKKMRFADHGDSGSVVVKKEPYWNLMAFGLVWRKANKIFCEKTDQFEELVLCVMLNTCLSDIIFEMTNGDEDTETVSEAVSLLSVRDGEDEGAYGPITRTDTFGDVSALTRDSGMGISFHSNVTVNECRKISSNEHRIASPICATEDKNNGYTSNFTMSHACSESQRAVYENEHGESSPMIVRPKAKGRGKLFEEDNYGSTYSAARAACDRKWLPPQKYPCPRLKEDVFSEKASLTHPETRKCKQRRDSGDSDVYSVDFEKRIGDSL